MSAREAPPGIRATLRRLIVPRRLVPMLAVAAAIVAAQAAYSDEPLAAPLGIALCLVFLGVAPVSYRLFFHDVVPLPRAMVLVVLYGAIGVGIVSALGLFIPMWLHMRPTLLTQPTNLIVCVALFLVGGWGLGRDLSLEDRLHQEAARADELAQRAEEAQLLALRAHLDPHFLFNTLNAIAEWCVVDGATAERAVLQLSQMLRTILGGVRARSWSLEEELALATRLCDLHRLRDPALVFDGAGLDATLAGARVPPMLLLPLVENAIKHGPAAGHPGAISLHVRRSGERISITLSNPGAYGGPRHGSHGLPTMEKRLELAYADRATFRIAGAGAHTLAELELPMQPEDRWTT